MEDGEIRGRKRRTKSAAFSEIKNVQGGVGGRGEVEDDSRTSWFGQLGGYVMLFIKIGKAGGGAGLGGEGNEFISGTG